MKTLKICTAILSAVLLSVHLPAQQKGGMMDPQQMTAKVKEAVTGITPDQESKILAAEQEFVKGAQDARSSSGGDRDAMRSKIQPLREARDSKIKGILNESQYAQYQKMEEAHQMGGGRSGGK